MSPRSLGSPPSSAVGKSQALTGLKIAVTGGLFGVMLWQLGLEPLTAFSSGLVWAWVVAKIVLHFAGLSLQAARWRLLLASQGVAASLRAVFFVNWTARFFSLALPSQYGGDAYRAVAKLSATSSRATVASTVVLDRMVGLLGLFVLVGLAGLIAPASADSSSEVRAAPFVAAAGLLVATPLIVMRRPSRLGLRAMAHLPIKRLRDPLSAVLRQLYTGPRPRSSLAVALGLSLLIHLASTTSAYASFRALGVDVSFAHVIVLVPMINLISQIPISINGLGVREGVFTLVFISVGVPAADAAAVALLSRVVNVALASTGGITLVLGGLVPSLWPEGRAVKETHAAGPANS